MTFAPYTRRIYARPVRSAFGLWVLLPPRPPRRRLICGSCSSGQSFAYSFLPTAPRGATVAVQLEVPGTQGPQGTHTPKSLPARLSPHGYQRQTWRCAPCLAHKKTERQTTFAAQGPLRPLDRTLLYGVRRQTHLSIRSVAQLSDASVLCLDMCSTHQKEMG